MTPLYTTQFPLAPPSVNNLFPSLTARKRVPSRQYAKWLRDMTPYFKPPPSPINSPVMVWIAIGDKLSKADIDNTVKAVLDMLVRRRVLATDSKRVVRGIEASYWDADFCQVEVWEGDDD